MQPKQFSESTKLQEMADMLLATICMHSHEMAFNDTVASLCGRMLCEPSFPP